MDIAQLYEDFGLDARTEGHKHCRPGFINVECPFCTTAYTNPGFHLSYNLRFNYFVCWRCGWHPIPQSIAALLKVTLREAYQIIRKYDGDILIPTQTKEQKKNKYEFRLPPLTTDLLPAHLKYLEKRKFDPDRIKRIWGILGTGPVSKIKFDDKTIDYKLRIVIPFYWGGKIVSFDSRAISKNTDVKYLACPLELEEIPHKEILYANQKYWKDRKIIIVEGPTDTWRFGPKSAATSGIKFTTAQLRFIANNFDRIAVVYDDNPDEAIKKAEELVAELKFRGKDAYRIAIKGDPGAMDQNEADYLVKNII